MNGCSDDDGTMGWGDTGMWEGMQGWKEGIWGCRAEGHQGRENEGVGIGCRDEGWWMGKGVTKRVKVMPERGLGWWNSKQTRQPWNVRSIDLIWKTEEFRRETPGESNLYKQLVEQNSLRNYPVSEPKLNYLHFCCHCALVKLIDCNVGDVKLEYSHSWLTLLVPQTSGAKARANIDSTEWDWKRGKTAYVVNIKYPSGVVWDSGKYGPHMQKASTLEVFVPSSSPIHTYPPQHTQLSPSLCYPLWNKGHYDHKTISYIVVIGRATQMHQHMNVTCALSSS